MELRESGRNEAQGKVRVHWRGDEGATYERVGRVSEVSGAECASFSKTASQLGQRFESSPRT